MKRKMKNVKYLYVNFRVYMHILGKKKSTNLQDLISKREETKEIGRGGESFVSCMSVDPKTVIEN